MQAHSLLSGADCVASLKSAGFRVRHQVTGVTTLTRERRAVVVPDVGLMTPNLLHSILRSAGVTLTELHACLPAARSRPRAHTLLDEEPPPTA